MSARILLLPLTIALLAACAARAPLTQRVPAMSTEETAGCALLGEVSGSSHHLPFAYAEARRRVLAAGGNAIEPLDVSARSGRQGTQAVVRARAWRCDV